MNEIKGRYLPQETIWEQFAGKRIVLASDGSPDQAVFAEQLAAVCAQQRSFELICGLEQARSGDLVLLFARMPKEAQAWDWTLRLMEQLLAVKECHPEAVLLVSGSEVYGKSFGVSHPLKEDELGYVCHTSQTDSLAQCMRQTEHFACRLAAEGQMPVRIVRTGTLSQEKAPHTFLEAAARVLLHGADGEIYNLPSCVAKDGVESRADGVRSPLEPSELVTDAQKSERLGK